MAPTPKPGTTVQVPVPGVPSEQEATSWATANGKLIAALILTVLAIVFLKFILKNKAVQILGTIIIVLFIGWLMWGRK